MALVSPDNTIWLYKLWLAISHTSSFGTSLINSFTWLISGPINAAIAPSPKEIAFCILLPLNLSTLATSLTSRHPVAAKAVYSPKECPAQEFISFKSILNSFFKTSNIAIETAMIAGWAFSVIVNFSMGPSNISFDKFIEMLSFMFSNTSLATVKFSYKSFPIPTLWDPCPGKIKLLLIFNLLLY